MRSIQQRLSDYLALALPQVAAHLGEDWNAEGHHLVAEDGRRLGVHPTYWHHDPGKAKVYPVCDGVYTDLPTVSVPVAGQPEAIARTIREDLLPHCPEPVPPVTVHLSGRGCRAAGYLDDETFRTLEEDAADAAGQLLAGETPHGFGRYYQAELRQAHARALLADWGIILEEKAAEPRDLRALERDAQRLRSQLDQLDRAQARATDKQAA